MNDNNRSTFVAHDALASAAEHRAPPPPSWSNASRCKRPALKPAARLSMFDRLLSLLGVK